MKYAKILGLAAMALAAMMAFAGTASATTLTSPSGTTYTGKIHAINEGKPKLVSSFIGTVECPVSTVEGTVEAHGTNVTVSGKISELTFTSSATEKCTGGTPTSPVAKPGTLEIHGTSTTGNGTLTSTGAEVIVHNTLAGSCAFKTENTHLGTLTGSNVTGGHATMDINGVAVKTSGSGLCGESATWTAFYTIDTPATLEVH